MAEERPGEFGPLPSARIYEIARNLGHSSPRPYHVCLYLDELHALLSESRPQPSAPERPAEKCKCVCPGTPNGHPDCVLCKGSGLAGSFAQVCKCGHERAGHSVAGMCFTTGCWCTLFVAGEVARPPSGGVPDPLQVVLFRRPDDGQLQYAPRGTFPDECIAPAPAEAASEGSDRERLGRIVRLVWVNWASEQANPKASWLKPWEELSEPDKEVDRRIGETLFDAGRASLAKRIEAYERFVERVRLKCPAWMLTSAMEELGAELSAAGTKEAK